MTEREKMLAGLPYDCGDQELLALWHRAKDLARDFNRTDSADLAEKDRILNKLLGSRGGNLWITPPFFVDYGVNIHFGDNCEVNMNCTFVDCNKILSSGLIPLPLCSFPQQISYGSGISKILGSPR